MTPPEIKPCPFCGAEAEWDEIEVGIIALCCSECKTIGPHCDGEQSHEEAARKWNCRGAEDFAA